MTLARDLKTEIKRCEDELSALKTELAAEEGVNGFDDAAATYIVLRLGKELDPQVVSHARGWIVSSSRKAAPHSNPYSLHGITREFRIYSPTLGDIELKVTK